MKFVYRFFVFLGVIFFLILLALSYLIIVDPYNLKPLFFGSGNQSEITEQTDTDIKVANENAVQNNNNATNEETSAPATVLNQAQSDALSAVGIDPETIPASISPAQKSCFISILGQARVDAIIAGDTPTTAELFKAKSCL